MNPQNFKNLLTVTVTVTKALSFYIFFGIYDLKTNQHKYSLQILLKGKQVMRRREKMIKGGD